MHDLPQYYHIDHDNMVKHLKPHGHKAICITFGLWAYNMCPIIFTLVVDDFGVNHWVEYHDLLLKYALDEEYKVPK